MSNTVKVYIAGHRGMVGRALGKKLQQQTGVELITRVHAVLDLSNQAAVNSFFQEESIDQIYLAAAKVGGIHANNTYPAEFLYQNLMIEANIIHAAHNNGVQKLLFLGSSCIYPKLAAQPMKETSLLTSTLEATNEPYAIAKITGIKLCESYNRQYGRDYRSIMPTNLYGENDNFHPENSHVIPALMRRFHEAKVNGNDAVTVWGSGKAMREFLYVDDMAEASVFVMGLDYAAYQKDTSPMLSHINVGTGLDCTIKEMAETMANVVGFKGKLLWDTTKPDGTPKKLMDVSRLEKLGWKATKSLQEGLKITYRWFLDNQGKFRR